METPQVDRVYHREETERVNPSPSMTYLDIERSDARASLGIDRPCQPEQKMNQSAAARLSKAVWTTVWQRCAKRESFPGGMKSEL